MDACKPKTSPIMGFGELQVWDEYLDFEDLSTRMVRNIINSHRALLVVSEENIFIVYLLV